MGIQLSDYSYLKTLWEKKKLPFTSNFSFSHNVFKSWLLLVRQNEYIWSKGLIELLVGLCCVSLDVLHFVLFDMYINIFGRMKYGDNTNANVFSKPVV